MKKFLLIAVMSLSATAYADIYKCVDDIGQPAFADGKTKISYKGCVLILRDDSPVPRSSGNIKSVNTRTNTPADFPRVDRQTQYQRDDKRKQILTSELESEKNALQDAKKAYAERLSTQTSGHDANSKVASGINNNDEKTQRLEADVSTHEKNIQLLQKELNVFH